MDHTSNKRQCAYASCIAETMLDVKTYYIKGVIFFVGSTYIIKTPETFDFVSIMLLVAPVFMDDYASIINAYDIKPLRWINYVVKFVNALVLIVCMLGLIHFMNDSGQSFTVVETAIIGSNLFIKKKWIVFVLGIDLLLTIVMAIVVSKKNESEIIIQSQIEIKNAC